MNRRFGLLFAVVALLGCLFRHPGSAVAQTPAARNEQHALLVVQFGNSSMVTRCVAFSEESISGLELLTGSGLSVARWGSAVCRIEQEGCDYPAKPCWCQCMGEPCRYWSYWQWRDGKWSFSQVGAASQRVREGDIEAWLWGDGKSAPDYQPSADFCAGADAVVTYAPTSAGMAAPGTRGPGAASERLKPPSLSQYAQFAIVSSVLLGAFWIVRRRHTG